MDRQEYFVYSLRTPSEYEKTYKRTIESIPQEEIREALLKFDMDLQEYMSQVEFNERIEREEEEVYNLYNTEITTYEVLPEHKPGLLAMYDSMLLVSDGTNWYQLNNGRVAQSDVQRSSKPKVEGSNPSTPKDRIDTLLIEDD